MTGFERDALGAAMLAGTPVSDLLNRAGVDTPAYVYDLGAMAAEIRAAAEGFQGAPGIVAYAVKANSAGSIIRALAREGAGADVVSGAELELALRSGVPPDRIVMSGVAKTDPELDLAIGSSILSIQIESIDEFERVAARARALGQQASISVRLNPGIAIDSHAHVATGHDQSKFGISLADLGAAWQGIDRAADVLRAVGVSTHIGSMLRSVEPYLEAARVVCEVAQARMSSGGWLKFVDFGGGFAIDYGSEPAPEPVAFVNAGIELLRRSGLERLALVIEPGRALVGPHGVLVASAIGVKNTQGTRWFLVDAAMNDLLRPALYGARHRIEPLERPPGGSSWRVAGPVCESADDFGDHPLGDPPPDRVVIRDAGAYGFSMASEYNGRPLPAEIFARDSELVSVAPSPGRGRWLESRLKA